MISRFEFVLLFYIKRIHSSAYTRYMYTLATVKTATSLLFFHLQCILACYFVLHFMFLLHLKYSCRCVVGFFSLNCNSHRLIGFTLFNCLPSFGSVLFYFSLSTSTHRLCCRWKSSIWTRRMIAIVILLTLSEMIQMFRNRK